ncbi:ribosome-associated translation inhibitor RaiA [Patescibacteria group bacterium]|nr:ribosome-associated translation inhibitor RaiA [Patescibacteria group bacterium]MBU4078164.1 ribosome-associated translation inhibitor RaiA [Patescibacteria group bacterium]MBU4161999.1 ribosome-associated translation inhibitor RaiA [Patescibacteria group bacterium]
MKVNIKTTNIEIDEALTIWVNDRIGELERILGVFGPDEFSAGEREKIEAFVEIGKISKHHLKGDVFRAEVQLSLPKKSLRAVVRDSDLRTAINIAKEEIQREIKKYKGKRVDRARGWARKLKERLRTTEVLQSRKFKKGI